MKARIERILVTLAVRACYVVLQRLGRIDLRNVEPHLLKTIDTFDVHVREDYILQRCKGRRVLHLGCAAYPFTQSRLQQGSLLHQKLSSVALSLVGVDASEEGIALVGKAIRDAELHVCSVYDMAALRTLPKFDVVLAGEIIEHLDKPGLMLKEAAHLLHDAGFVLATIPNAFKYRNFFAAQQRLELVHEEHVAWYSPMTARRLFAMSGYRGVSVSGYKYNDHWIGSQFVGHSPLFCDGLIVEAKPCDRKGTA